MEAFGRRGMQPMQYIVTIGFARCRGAAADLERELRNRKSRSSRTEAGNLIIGCNSSGLNSIDHLFFFIQPVCVGEEL